jgi:flagellin
MAQVINTNVGALFAGAALNKSAISLQTAQERLSSGLRINSAKDDAAGLVRAIGYDTAIRAANVASRNALDAISTAQTKDGYLSIVTENLQRIAEIGAGDEATALGTENTRLEGLAGGSTGLTLATIGAERAIYGAEMAKKASLAASKQVEVVNTSAAYSRVMDTDYAAESTAQARSNILQQAGTAVLAQANQTAQTVLSLLR